MKFGRGSSHSNEMNRRSPLPSINNNQENVEGKGRRRDPETGPTGHIMLSYEHGSAELVRKVRDSLRECDLPIWFDEENMGSNVFDGMSAAVEDAQLLLVFYSQGYMKSQNCRREFEYSTKLGKPFIPVRVQEKYAPDGWLGLILGNAFYYDISVPNRFNDNLPKLVHEIRKRSGTSLHGPEAALTAVKALAEFSSHRPEKTERTEKQMGTASWSAERVLEWLQQEGLVHLQDSYLLPFQIFSTCTRLSIKILTFFAFTM